MRGRWRGGVLVAAAAVIAGFGAACGGDPTVAESEVEATVKTELGKLKGREPERIDCPSGLPAKIGATLRCVLEDQGVRFGLTVTATAVEGDSVRYDIKVDDQPMT